jgi:hypothetical protein
MENGSGGPSVASIAEQIRTLELARQALTGARPAEALHAVDQYRARWPNGTLLPEAVLLGVRAKKMLGDEAGVERDARAWLARDPDSRYATRLRALLASAPEQ